MGRRGLRVCDFLDKDDFLLKLKKLYEHHNIWLSAIGESKQNPSDIFLKLWEQGQFILSFVQPSWLLISKYNSISSGDS